MMRNWLLGIFVIGLTVFCLFRAYFGPVEAGGESSAGLLIAGEPGADLLSVTPLPGRLADAGTGTEELAAEDNEEETAERILRAIERNEKRLLMPALVRALPLLRLLPISWFDAIAEHMGINASMDEFKGRNPNS